MSNDTPEAPTPRPRRKAAGATPSATEAKPKRPPAGKPPAERIEELAGEAVEKGRKLLETETGQKVAAAADKAFDKAEELGRKALDSDVGKEASATARKIWETPLGRNVGIGAGAGAALGLFILNPLLGAIIGGGLGYLRTITKK